jgi:hypothetical protein
LAFTRLTDAAEKKPNFNTLTPQEVADGWLLLFDGESTYGWATPTGSKWTIFNGMLAPQGSGSGLLVTTTAFRDYELKLQYRIRNDAKVSVLTGCDASGKPREPRPQGAKGEVSSALAQLLYQGDDWMEAIIHVRNSQVTGHETHPVSGLLRFASATKGGPPVEDPRPVVGHIAFEGSGVIFRGIKIRPTSTKSLFNGKDLTGWKKYEGDTKRAKSTFAVSPEGWLTIKDGPGDLQTTEQWSDFILQIECKTNGDKLNSGVFFRCRPGEYQNGYEAQIHNGWGPEKKYVVEEYDPKTHEPKKKIDVTSTAMDYGTGAIYRRIPARRAVAKDREWFTMTVVAEGNHLATWVDGVQVVDWNDNRPPADNARNGCKLEKGPISLQGHDPTTDLSFRNIRIEDLTASKGGDKKEEPRK